MQSGWLKIEHLRENDEIQVKDETKIAGGTEVKNETKTVDGTEVAGKIENKGVRNTCVELPKMKYSDKSIVKEGTGIGLQV